MISMYSDSALEQPFDSRSNVRPLKLHREAARHRLDNPTARSPQGRAISPPALPAHGVGSLQGDTLHDDSLDAARGMALAVVLGLGCWMLIGVAVRVLFF